MLRVNLTRNDGGPQLHEQVAAQIRRAIAEGEAGAGDRLPPAQDLAAEIGVNRNTVLRALRTLRDEGLVDFRRGRGVIVTARPSDGVLAERAREFVVFAQRIGYQTDEVVSAVERAARLAR
jgi:GntR family transcriptional regulator